MASPSYTLIASPAAAQLLPSGMESKTDIVSMHNELASSVYNPKIMTLWFTAVYHWDVPNLAPPVIIMQRLYNHHALIFFMHYNIIIHVYKSS